MKVLILPFAPQRSHLAPITSPLWICFTPDAPHAGNHCLLGVRISRANCAFLTDATLSKYFKSLGLLVCEMELIIAPASSSRLRIIVEQARKAGHSVRDGGRLLPREAGYTLGVTTTALMVLAVMVGLIPVREKLL